MLPRSMMVSSKKTKGCMGTVYNGDEPQTPVQVNESHQSSPMVWSPFCETRSHRITVQDRCGSPGLGGSGDWQRGDLQHGKHTLEWVEVMGTQPVAAGKTTHCVLEKGPMACRCVACLPWMEGPWRPVVA